MKLTYTAVFADLVNDFYQKNAEFNLQMQQNSD